MYNIFIYYIYILFFINKGIIFKNYSCLSGSVSERTFKMLHSHLYNASLNPPSCLTGQCKLTTL